MEIMEYCNSSHLYDWSWNKLEKLIRALLCHSRAILQNVFCAFVSIYNKDQHLNLGNKVDLVLCS